MVKPIINLFRTLDEALYFKNSPINRFYKFNGVQLLPNNPIPYVQVTNTPLGLDLEDWTVYGVDLRTGNKQDITDSFNVDGLTNSENGNPQLIWSLTDVPIDFGIKMIYLQIEQALGETFYSQPFLLTDYGKDRTTQFHYKEKVGDTIQCIGMKSWFRQPKKETELSTYYELSTKRTVTESIKTNIIEIHMTEMMSLEQLIKLSTILESPYLYINSFRAHLYKALEIPELKENQNYAQITFYVTVDEDSVYVPAIPSNGDWIGSDWEDTDWFIYNA